MREGETRLSLNHRLGPWASAIGAHPQKRQGTGALQDAAATSNARPVYGPNARPRAKGGSPCTDSVNHSPSEGVSSFLFIFNSDQRVQFPTVDFLYPNLRVEGALTLDRLEIRPN